MAASSTRRRRGQPFVPAAGLSAELSWVGGADEDEASLEQDSPGGNVRVGRGRPDFAQPECRRRVAAELVDVPRREAMTSDVLGDPIAEDGRAAIDIPEVEPADDRAAVRDEHEVRVPACLLLCQQFGKPRGELREELLATVRDEGREVRPVGQLEREYGRLVFGPQPLEFRGSSQTRV